MPSCVSISGDCAALSEASALLLALVDVEFLGRDEALRNQLPGALHPASESRQSTGFVVTWPAPS